MERQALTITLTPEDLDQIQSWYESASGESATGPSDPVWQKPLADLLLRLGIPITDSDQYFLNKPPEQ